MPKGMHPLQKMGSPSLRRICPSTVKASPRFSYCNGSDAASDLNMHLLFPYCMALDQHLLAGMLLVQIGSGNAMEEHRKLFLNDAWS